MKVEVIVKIDGVEVSRQETEYKKPEGKTLNVSRYARFFDSECFPNWSTNSRDNLFFLKHVEVYANNLLKSRYIPDEQKGHLYLNEVYDMLGMSRTIEGQFVGWVYYQNNPIGDNYVSFDLCAEHNMDFINGKTTVALLDFNVDGVILDKF